MKRYHNDIRYRIENSLRNFINYTLRQFRNNKIKKYNTTKKLLGCSLYFFIKYIENKFSDGMNWNNYGKNGWELDHIEPSSSFNLINPKEQMKCFHYTNYQPLWAKDNRFKSNISIDI